jgi:hypothetical protein
MYGARFIVLSCTLLSCSVAHPRATEVPDNGFVPDEKTAIRIAEAAIAARFGETTVVSERPFHAKLVNEVWNVAGSMHCCEGRDATVETPGDGVSSNEACLCVGGVASAKISRHDGTILQVTATQ